MEIFLNIFWVLIVLAGVIVWRTRWARESRVRRHAAWREWTAFVSVMVLLFFVVSLTDDLHAELMLFEEYSTNRRHATCLNSVHHSPPTAGGSGAHASAILPRGPCMQSAGLEALVLSVSENLHLLLNIKSASGRAPPASVL